MYHRTNACNNNVRRTTVFTCVLYKMFRVQVKLRRGKIFTILQQSWLIFSMSFKAKYKKKPTHKTNLGAITYLPLSFGFLSVLYLQAFISFDVYSSFVRDVMVLCHRSCEADGTFHI